MKMLYPKLLCIVLALAIYSNNRNVDQGTEKTTAEKTDYSLEVRRGGLHNDRFTMTLDDVRYTPAKELADEDSKYSRPSHVALPAKTAPAFFEAIEAKGFWQLRDRYITEGSCTSQLTVTLTAQGKSKTLICDDIEHDCPTLIKYIDQKVVELEGNGLKRIYLPG